MAELSVTAEIRDRIIEWNLDWINVLDLEGRLLSMNFGGMKALEICEVEPLKNRPWLEFWHGRDERVAREALAAATRGEIGRFTGECATSAGESKWWDVMVSAIRDREGRPEGLLVVARDVTDRRRAVETLRVVTEGTAAVSAGDFFLSLARHLAQALAVRYSFIAECTDEAKTQVRTLAFWCGEDFRENVSFPLRETPCEKVVGGQVCSYPDRLQLLFPNDKGLVDLKAQSYLGVPLHGSSGDIVGHLVVMDIRPMMDMEQHLPVMRIFAARAGVELERKRAREALQKSQQRLRTLLDINNAIVSRLNRDELFEAVSQALSRFIHFDRLALSLYESDANVLRLITYAGPYQRADYSPVGRVLQLDDSPAGLAFLNQRPILRCDLESEQQTSSERRAFGHGFRSLCALPLVVRGKSIGAITVGSLTKNRYSEADAEFLMEVANQVAIAVDNMKSYEEIESLKARFQAEAVYLQEEIKTEHKSSAKVRPCSTCSVRWSRWRLLMRRF